MKRNVLVIAVAGLIAIIAGYFIVPLFLYNEERNIEQWLYKAAADIPQNESEDFLKYVDLEQYGIRLDIHSMKTAFSGADKEKFVSVARNYSKILKGSSLDLSNIEIAISGSIAKIDMNVLYKSGKDSKSFIKRAFLDVNMKIVIDKNGYKVADFTAKPSRNPIGSIF